MISRIKRFTLIAIAVLLALTAGFILWYVWVENISQGTLDSQDDANIGIRLAEKSTQFILPVTLNDVDAVIPVNQITLEKSRMQIAMSGWQLDLPLQLSWQRQPVPTLNYRGTGIELKTKGLAITTGEASANISLKTSDNRWDGIWEIKNISITGTPSPVPVINGRGIMVLHADNATITGQLHDPTDAYKVGFDLRSPFAAPARSMLTITDASMPWNGGTLSVHGVTIPLGKAAPIKVKLKITHVSAPALMQQFLGEKASATGTISGDVPLTIEPSGNIILHQGSLHADAPGTITMSPEVVPGDNAQVALVREVLKDFHYTSLSFQVNSGENNRLALSLKLEGNNPQVQGGRAVKMTVNLNGDVLDLIEQNLLWLNDPKKIIERGQNARP